MILFIFGMVIGAALLAFYENARVWDRWEQLGK